MEISLTRALAEIKMLDAQISERIVELQVVDLEQEKMSVLMISKKTKDQFVKDAKASMQSIDDLISNRLKIKKALVRANATAKIKIGEDEYTIAEAIERKKSIDVEVQLLNTLIYQHSNANSVIDRQKPKLDEAVQNLVNTSLGKEAKPTDEAFKVITGSFIKQNELRMVDPVSILENIAKRKGVIEEFKKNIDFLLSEVNASTKIDI